MYRSNPHPARSPSAPKKTYRSVDGLSWNSEASALTVSSPIGRLARGSAEESNEFCGSFLSAGESVSFNVQPPASDLSNFFHQNLTRPFAIGPRHIMVSNQPNPGRPHRTQNQPACSQARQQSIWIAAS